MQKIYQPVFQSPLIFNAQHKNTTQGFQTRKFLRSNQFSFYRSKTQHNNKSKQNFNVLKNQDKILQHSAPYQDFIKCYFETRVLPPPEPRNSKIFKNSSNKFTLFSSLKGLKSQQLRKILQRNKRKCKQQICNYKLVDYKYSKNMKQTKQIRSKQKSEQRSISLSQSKLDLNTTLKESESKRLRIKTDFFHDNFKKKIKYQSKGYIQKNTIANNNMDSIEESKNSQTTLLKIVKTGTTAHQSKYGVRKVPKKFYQNKISSKFYQKQSITTDVNAMMKDNHKIDGWEKIVQVFDNDIYEF